MKFSASPFACGCNVIPQWCLNANLANSIELKGVHCHFLVARVHHMWIFFSIFSFVCFAAMEYTINTSG